MTYALNCTEQNSQSQRMMFRSPKRISITIPHNAYEHLLRQSDQEGRSLSNLAAFLLESAIRQRVSVSLVITSMKHENTRESNRH
jgi:hypothetical protein